MASPPCLPPESIDISPQNTSAAERRQAQSAGNDHFTTTVVPQSQYTLPWFLPSSDRWLQLLNLHMQPDTEGASSSNIIGSGRHDHDDQNGSRSISLPSPRTTTKDSGGLRDRAPPCSSAVFSTQRSWGSCLGPLAKSNQSIQTSLTSMSSNRTGRAQSPHTHWGPRSPASASLPTGSTPSVVPAASSPTKETPAAPVAAKTGQQQCKVFDCSF